MAKKISAKKTTKKTVVKKTTSVQAARVPEKSKPASSKTFQTLLTKRNIITVLVAIIILLAAVLYMFRGLFVAATVNGQVISRFTLTAELDKKAGKQTLEALVTKDLILQEMAKKNITVTDAQVNTELKKIEDTLSKQGRTLTDALSQQGLTKADLVDQLRIQKMIEKLFAKNITVSGKEIDAFLAQNKDSLPAGQDPAALRVSAEAQIKQQKLTAKFQAWLAALQKTAKIQYFVNF